jgi:hypothetical protein
MKFKFKDFPRVLNSNKSQINVGSKEIDNSENLEMRVMYFTFDF